MFNTKTQSGYRQNSGNAFEPVMPFVGHNDPFVGHGSQGNGPLIGKNIPFVRNQGFTMVELMITLAIFAIIGSFALPAFRDTILNMRIKSDTSDIVGALQVARSESVKRKLPIGFCGKNPGLVTCSVKPDWSQGWIMWVDSNADGVYDDGVEEILRQKDAPESGVTIETFAAIAQLAYRPDGSSDVPVNTEFRICDNNRIGERGRRIQIGITGRTKTEIFLCDQV